MLEAEHTPASLEGSDEYRALVDEHERLQGATREATTGMDWTGFERLAGDL